MFERKFPSEFLIVYNKEKISIAISTEFKLWTHNTRFDVIGTNKTWPSVATARSYILEMERAVSKLLNFHNLFISFL